jgi:hypothetical protein
MISETLPLNEWPSKKLWQMYGILSIGRFGAESSDERDAAYNFIQVVKSAIKDAEERENQLPFK